MRHPYREWGRWRREKTWKVNERVDIQQQELSDVIVGADDGVSGLDAPVLQSCANPSN